MGYIIVFINYQMATWPNVEGITKHIEKHAQYLKLKSTGYKSL